MRVSGLRRQASGSFNVAGGSDSPALAARCLGIFPDRPLGTQRSRRCTRRSSAAPPAAPTSSQVIADLEQPFRAAVIEAYGMTEAAHQMASNPLPPGERKPGTPKRVFLPPGDSRGRHREAPDRSRAKARPGLRFTLVTKNKAEGAMDARSSDVQSNRGWQLIFAPACWSISPNLRSGTTLCVSP